MAVADSTLMILLLDETQEYVLNEKTGKSVPYVQERIAGLLAGLSKSREKLIIPAPALGEILVHAGTATQEYLSYIQRQRVFSIAPFDTKAALECALMTKAAKDAGDKRQGNSEPWQKVKIDRQIIAIAKSLGETSIYTSDGKMAKFAKSLGLNPITVDDIPIPDAARQSKLDFEEGEPNRLKSVGSEVADEQRARAGSI